MGGGVRPQSQDPHKGPKKASGRKITFGPACAAMERAGQYGVSFIFPSMEQGRAFAVSMPKLPTQDPNHRILRAQRRRFTHYYFYLRDEALGPMVMRVASFFPFQATYYLNGHSFIERELNRRKIGFRKNAEPLCRRRDRTADRSSNRPRPP